MAKPMTATRPQSATVTGVCFHGVGSPGPDTDAEAANYFIARDLFLRILDDVMDRPDIDLTFDDGYTSDVEIALPALVQRGLTARFFPLAGRLGRPGHVSADGVRALTAAGMHVGSHGMTHRSWRGLDSAATLEELSTARARIAEAAGVPVTTAACPFGEYDRRVLGSLRTLGYRQVFTSDRRRARPGSWLQPRYSVRRTDTAASVRQDILAPPPLAARIRGAVVHRVKAWR
jgi:peptidoglycan/xylan/chitin deacetylase (PgdA/CDA1 family)